MRGASKSYSALKDGYRVPVVSEPNAGCTVDMAWSTMKRTGASPPGGVMS